MDGMNISCRHTNAQVYMYTYDINPNCGVPCHNV